MSISSFSDLTPLPMRPFFLRSFQHAVRGLRYCFLTERNFRFQIALGLLAIAASFALPILSWQRILVWFVVMTVLVLELVNSSMERLVDLVKPQFHESARDIKDLMAAAVLLASFFAVLTGIMIFLPAFFLALRAV
jgi:diacylglycerol kinase